MEINLGNVAIRFVKYADGGSPYAIFELGRVTDYELEKLEKAYRRPLSPMCGDPTNGTIQKSKVSTRLYTVRLCLFIGNICDGKDLIEKTCDNSNVVITYTSTNVRPTLKSIEHGTSEKSWFERFPVDWDRCVKEEIETNTTQPKDSLEIQFVNVAVRNVKKASSHDYYILEIGRLTCGELSNLKKVFRYTGHSNDDIVSDETNGEVVSKEVLVQNQNGERLSGYHMAKICVYWPGCPLVAGTVNDAAVITLESHDGNYRPTVKDIRSVDASTNNVTKNWFGRFPFEAKDDDPIKIRLNNVAVVTVTHYRDCTANIVFSLTHCCNYRQAVDDIGEALTVREGEPGRGISWNPTTKILEITIRDDRIKDIASVADIHTRLWMCEFQYDPDNGSWGVNGLHKMGGYTYFCPSRGSGKTAELKRVLNAAYGLHSIPEGADFDGDTIRYCMHDVVTQESMWRVLKKKSEEEETMKFGVPKIKQLIFDDPTTVVIWEDGTKTIVHARDEKFDPEKGLAMAIARKALGNDREYYTYMQRQIKKGLRDSEGRKKKDEKPAAKKKAPAKKPATAPKKKGGKK